MPQGDALAIAAPAMPVVPQPTAVRSTPDPAPRAADAVASGGGATVEGAVPLLYLPLADGADSWVAGTSAATLALPVRIVAAPFCRAAVVVDKLSIALEPRTWAVLRRDDDGTPRLEIAFGGATVVVPRTQIEIEEENNRRLAILPSGVTLQELVNGLNALGFGPRDMITILQAIKTAGALQADIEVM